MPPGEATYPQLMVQFGAPSGPPFPVTPLSGSCVSFCLTLLPWVLPTNPNFPSPSFVHRVPLPPPEASGTARVGCP